KFSAPDITKEREVIKEEIAMYLDEPQHQVQELLNAALWPQQPLGRPITGTPQTLDAMKRKELLRFLRTHYNSGCTVIAAAGKITHRQVLRAVRGYAANFPPGTRMSFASAQANQHESRVHLFTKDTEQTQVAFGIRTWSRHDERRYPLRLL